MDNPFYDFTDIATHEFNIPLVVLAKIARLDRTCYSLTYWRLRRTARLYKKYRQRLCISAWRKILHYPLADVVVREVLEDSSKWRINSNMIYIYDQRLKASPLAMITKISFIATTKFPFMFYVLVPDQHGQLFRAADFKITENGYTLVKDGKKGEVMPTENLETAMGAYRVNIDLRTAPLCVHNTYFSIMICNFDSPSPLQVFDNRDIATHVTHIGYSYEEPASIPLKIPYKYSSKEELNLMFSLYIALCNRIYAMWSKKSFTFTQPYEDILRSNTIARETREKIRLLRRDSNH